MRWAKHVARLGERRGAYRGFVGNPEGKRWLGKPTCIYEDNIKMGLKEIAGRTWSGFIRLRVRRSGGLV
jgi:hypothetical protein